MTPNQPHPWWADAAVYQIYVRSFADANGDGLGDLAGIISKLDYVVDLGVDAIWLNPCYPSPQDDHGYDVSDYFDIEPDYGDLATFDRLVAAANARGLRVVMDIVPNHCSSEHAWFRAALDAGPGSAERERFYFRDGRGPNGDEPPNNWRSMFGGIAWTRTTTPDGAPGQWYLHSFAPQQPDWNWLHPEVIDHFDRVLRFWLDRGADGFRVDAPTPVGKAPGLPDAPAMPVMTEAEAVGYNPYNTFRPEGHEVWRHWRAVIDGYERDHAGREIVMIAETYAPKRPELAADYIRPGEFHQAFCFELMSTPWTASRLRDTVTEIIETRHDLAMNTAWALNNHDVARAVTRLGRPDATDDSHWGRPPIAAAHVEVDVALGTRRTRAALLLMLALPGAVYLYQGEELGLPEVLDLDDAHRQDPSFFRTNGAELGRDGCRVPLPWTDDAATSYGFSAVDAPQAPWMPQPADWGRWAASTQAGDDGSTLRLFQRAIAARGAAFAPPAAPLEWLEVDNDDLLAFRRGNTIVVMNTSGSARPLPAMLGRDLRVLLCSAPDRVVVAAPVEVPPNAAMWLTPG